MINDKEMKAKARKIANEWTKEELKRAMEAMDSVFNPMIKERTTLTWALTLMVQDECDKEESKDPSSPFKELDD